MYQLSYLKGSGLFAAHIAMEEIGCRYDATIVHEHVPDDSSSLAPPPYGLSVLGQDRLGSATLVDIPTMLIFLAHNHPCSALLSREPCGQIRCLEWLNWISSQLEVAFAQISHPEDFTIDPKCHHAIITNGWWKIEEHFERIERELSIQGANSEAIRPLIPN